MHAPFLRTATVAAWAIWACACSDPVTSSPDASSAKDGAVAETSADGGDTASSADSSGDAQQDSGSADTAIGAGVLTPRPLRFEQDLLGIWGSGPNDVWAVGDKGLILHWNGKILVPRASGVDTALRGVGGSSPSDVWFVGDKGRALHWDGLSLSDKSPGNLEFSLRAVAAPEDGATVLAAGDAGTIYRYQEGAWQLDLTKASFDLHSLAMAGAGQAWAVGNQGQALKLSGGLWATVSLPQTCSGSKCATLHAVARSPGGRWYACGDLGYLAATSGGTWEATLANDTQSRDVYGVWAVSEMEAWAVGQLGVLLHLVGKKWQLDDIAGTYMKQATLRALWGTSPVNALATVAYAVGDKGAGIRFDEKTGKWLDFRAETTSDLRQIVAMADGSLVACGTGGAVLRAADATAPFYDLAAPVTAADLWDCAAVGESLWVAGDAGLAARWTASAGWTVEKTGLAGAVTGLAPLGQQVLAVSDSGQAALRDAAGLWTLEKTANQLPLRAVAVSDGVAIAVGDVGTVLRRAAGGGWSLEALAETGDLHRVIAWAGSSGSADAMAVGDFGAIWTRKAGKWEKGFEAPDLPLYGATRKADGTLIAVGWQGTLVVSKAGGPFAKVATNTPGVLRAIASTPKGTVAVGLKGSIFGVVEALP